jgi:hypothetical protein
MVEQHPDMVEVRGSSPRMGTMNKQYTLLIVSKFDCCTSIDTCEVGNIEEAVDELFNRGAYPTDAIMFDGKPVTTRWNENGDDLFHLLFIERMEQMNRDDQYREYLRLKAVYEPNES